jgi:hypothetical protein
MVVNMSFFQIISSRKHIRQIFTYMIKFKQDLIKLSLKVPDDSV